MSLLLNVHHRDFVTAYNYSVLALFNIIVHLLTHESSFRSPTVLTEKDNPKQWLQPNFNTAECAPVAALFAVLSLTVVAAVGAVYRSEPQLTQWDAVYCHVPWNLEIWNLHEILKSFRKSGNLQRNPKISKSRTEFFQWSTLERDCIARVPIPRRHAVQWNTLARGPDIFLPYYGRGCNTCRWLLFELSYELSVTILQQYHNISTISQQKT